MKDFDASGADIVLAVLRLTANWHDIQASIQYRWATEEWDDTLAGMAEIEPRYMTSLNCSDTFFWGTSDHEEVTHHNLDILEATVAELKPLWLTARIADNAVYQLEKAERAQVYADWKTANPDSLDAAGWRTSVEFAELAERYRALYRAKGFSGAVADLFAARSRQERPQGACYSGYDRSIWSLFDACGPEREVGLGNPYVPGEYDS